MDIASREYRRFAISFVAGVNRQRSLDEIARATTGIGRRDHGRTRRGIKCQHFGWGSRGSKFVSYGWGWPVWRRGNGADASTLDSGSVGKFACSLGYRLIRHVLIVVEWRPIV